MAKRHHARHKRQKNRFRYRARRAHNRFGSRRRRARHHNPFSTRGLSKSIGPVLIGAGGAVGLDVLMAYLPLPTTLQSGWMNILARAAGAVALGFVAGKVAGRDVGKEVAAGGLVVVAYSGLKQVLAPTLGTSIKGLSGLADFGDYRPAVPAYSGQSAAMVGGGMGAYMVPRMGAYMNPASILTQAGAGASPVRAKQMGAYMRASLGNFGGYDSDSM